VTAPSDPAVVVLGLHGGPILSPDRSQPAHLLRVGDARYLVDFGAGAARQMVRAGDGFAGLRAAFLTHHHLDHLVGLGELCAHGWLHAPSRLDGLDLWGPPPLRRVVEETLAALSHSMSLMEPATDVPVPSPQTIVAHEVELPPEGIGEIMTDEHVRVTGTRVFHGEEVAHAYAYRFDLPASGSSVVFSGDTACNDQLIALAQGADLLVHEVQLNSAVDALVARFAEPQREAVRRHLVDTHTSTTELAEVAAAAEVGRVAMCHYSPGPVSADRCLAEVREAAVARGYRGEIIAPDECAAIAIRSAVGP